MSRGFESHTLRTSPCRLLSGDGIAGTRNGDRVVVLLSVDDYDSLLETVDVLSRLDDIEAIRRGLAELDAGDVFSADEVRAAMLARGRITA